MGRLPECAHFYDKAQIEERKRERRRPVAPTSSSHRRRSPAQVSRDRPFGPRCHFVGASGIYPSNLRTSSDSSLGGLANALSGLENALGGLTATPDDVFSWVGGGGSAFLGNGARFGSNTAMWWSVFGRVSRTSWRGKREISSVSCADGKTVASAVSRRGICAARAQAQIRPKTWPRHVLI